MSTDCGTTTPDGNAVCIPSAQGQTNGCGCAPAAKTSQPTRHIILHNQDQSSEPAHVEKNS